MHPFPLELEQALLSAAQFIPLSVLAQTYAELSNAYRHQRGYALTSRDQAIAYALARMPATYNVLSTVLKECRDLVPSPHHSCLDIGSGPGTSYWALKALYPEIRILTSVEPNPFMRHISQETIPSPLSFLETLTDALPHDMVIASYVVGEMSKDQQKSFVKKAWDLTQHVLILTGPGTPKGFQELADLRIYLIKHKAHIVAPCGHNAPCPLLRPNDWCHFTTRLDRRPFHKVLKTAIKGYEDEKYVYLIATRAPAVPQGLRILKNPRHHKGRVVIETCEGDHVREHVFLKSKTTDFKKIKKLRWGDAWDKG